MKKYILTMIFALAMFSCFAYAENVVATTSTAPVATTESKTDVSDTVKAILAKINFSAGIAYDINDKKTVTPLTFKVVEYNKATNPDSKFQVALAKLDPALLAGYVPTDKFVVGGSFVLAKASDFGVNIPVLDLITIEPMVLYGWGDLNFTDLKDSEDSWMIGSRIWDVKF